MTDTSFFPNFGLAVYFEIALALLVIPGALVVTYFSNKMKPVHVILAFMAMEMPFILLGVFSQILAAKVWSEGGDLAVDETARFQIQTAYQAEMMKYWYIPIFMIFYLGTLLAVSIMRAKKGATAPKVTAPFNA